MSANKVNNITKELLIYVALLIILLITSLNINNYLRPKQVKVLGTETVNREEIFWQDFLAKNPDYVPGWIEIGRMDMALKIDPNFKP